jgi:membrane protease subunit (stomatin/prohibitin family)
MMRRRRGPGLIGMAARTAVVAGTATAVSGRVAQRQHDRWAAEQGQQDAVSAPQQAASAPQAADEPAYMAELERLAELRNKGIVTPEEFEAKKKQILGI